MRVNIYAEEMTDRLELVEKDGFTGLRFYLELPVTLPGRLVQSNNAVAREASLKPAFGEVSHVAGPFIHKPGDDDSGAVTFWGKRDLRVVLRKALVLLDEHYGKNAHE